MSERTEFIIIVAIVVTALTIDIVAILSAYLDWRIF